MVVFKDGAIVIPQCEFTLKGYFKRVVYTRVCDIVCQCGNKQGQYVKACKLGADARRSIRVVDKPRDAEAVIPVMIG